MTTFDPRVLAWLRAHHATISPGAMHARSEEDAALTRRQRRRRVGDGSLLRLVDGAYLFTGALEDELVRCAALCTSRPALVVCGPTAARLWELRRAPHDGLVHVIAPPQSNPCVAAWVKPYRTTAPDEEDVVRRGDGIRLTSPPRTVVDMTRYVGDLDVSSMLEQALERRMCTEATLRRVAGRLATRGRPWVRTFLRLLDARATGAAAESDWEHRVHRELHRRGVTDLIRQHWVDLPAFGRARFDLAIPGIRWALEIDVHPEHRTLEGAAQDNRRDAAANLAGWAVSRVAELQLSRDLDHTIETVVRSIGRCREWMR